MCSRKSHVVIVFFKSRKASALLLVGQNADKIYVGAFQSDFHYKSCRPYINASCHTAEKGVVAFVDGFLNRKPQNTQNLS